MTALLVGLLICVGVAVVVIVVVALPHLRTGASLLAPPNRPAPQAWAPPPAAGTTHPDPQPGPQPAAPPDPVGPPQQVPSAAATPAPGTSLGNEPQDGGRHHHSQDDPTADAEADLQADIQADPTSPRVPVDQAR